MNVLEVLCNDNYLMYNLVLAKNVGIDEAIMIGEFARKYNYWRIQGRLSDEGYFFIIQEDIEEDTGLSPYRQRQATKHLKDLGILEVKKLGGLNRANYYKVNDNALLKYLTSHSKKITPSLVNGLNDTNTTYTNTTTNIYSEGKNLHYTTRGFKSKEKNNIYTGGAAVSVSAPIDPDRSEVTF